MAKPSVARVSFGARLPAAWSLLFGATIGVAACVFPLDTPPPFVLEFPATESLGALSIVEDVNCFTCGTGSQDLGEARGPHTIQLPAQRWFVSLVMPRAASALMHHLSHPSLAKIGNLNLRGSDVTDDDLRHLANVDLRSIDLSGTAITGEGLRHLRPHARWTFVTLLSCPQLDPKYLRHFAGWKRSTIRLVPYKSSGQTYSDAERQLLERAQQEICDGRTEEECGTQIR